KQEFEGRRLFVNIVDTVSIDSPSPDHVILPTIDATGKTVLAFDDPAALLPTAVAIGLQPSEQQPEYYGFVSRKIAEELRCVDASDADFEQDTSIPEYILTVDEANTLSITRDEDDSRDADALMRRVAMLAGMTEDEADKLELTDCWYMRSPEVMRINVAAGGEPMMRSGWIVERYPLGTFYKRPEQQYYRAPVFLTNYSYIDGVSGSIIDVFESRNENGKHIWIPTGWPAFARTDMVQVDVENVGKASNFTTFRETANGVLVTTLAQTMSLSYIIGEKVFDERIALDGHHYHVSCHWNENEMTVYTSILGRSTVRPANPIKITLSATDGSSSFKCEPKRATPTGIPEVLQLDYVEQSGGRSIPSSDREVTVRKWNARIEETTTNAPKSAAPSLSDPEWIGKNPSDNENNEAGRIYESTTIFGEKNEKLNISVRPEQAPAFVDIARQNEDSLSSLAMMILGVSILAITAVTCALACTRECIRRKHNSGEKTVISEITGDAVKRKNGQQDLANATLKPVDASTTKSDENEDLKPSIPPTRSNSGKKKSITFAPRKSTMTTEDLVKMITESELGTKIDAMVEAGPDGEEEVEKKGGNAAGEPALRDGGSAGNEDKVKKAQHDPTAGSAATAEIVDETSPSPKKEFTEKSG
ncbi:hypothetical protein PMAYCL1PPCAC_26263, partial [Pristionchus mayeri]